MWIKFILPLCFAAQFSMGFETELNQAIAHLSSTQQEDMIIALTQAVVASMALPEDLANEERIQELALANPERLTERIRQYGHEFRKVKSIDELLENASFQQAIFEARLQQRVVSKIDTSNEKHRHLMDVIITAGLAIIAFDIILMLAARPIEPYVGRAMDKMYASMKKSFKEWKGGEATSKALPKPNVSFT